MNSSGTHPLLQPVLAPDTPQTGSQGQICIPRQSLSACLTLDTHAQRSHARLYPYLCLQTHMRGYTLDVCTYLREYTHVSTYKDVIMCNCMT